MYIVCAVCIGLIVLLIPTYVLSLLHQVGYASVRNVKMLYVICLGIWRQKSADLGILKK